jgi:hypothetical protein
MDLTEVTHLLAQNVTKLITVVKSFMMSAQNKSKKNKGKNNLRSWAWFVGVH